ncbi:MAG: hypothetical protein ACRD12_10160 [Acidimicrobiales bacterium]
MDDRTYVDRVVRITELVEVGGVLDGFTFERCHITGPAVIALDCKGVMNGCSLGAETSALLWEVPPTRPRVTGVLVVRNCNFIGCSFSNVGIAAPPDVAEMIRRHLAA